MTSYSRDVKTPLGRFAFTEGLFELQTTQSGKKQWNATMLFPKSVDISELKTVALEACVEEWGDKAREWVANGTIKNPFLDGDGKQGLSKKTGQPHAGFPGHTFIRLSSGEDHRPNVINQQTLPATKAEFYSGCYGYALVHAYTWDHPQQGKGVSFGVSIVQKAKEGERLGRGAPDPSQHFEKIEDEDAGEAPAETKDGKGAAGLFG